MTAPLILTCGEPGGIGPELAARAREAGVPIVPVVCVGGHEALVILAEGAGLARKLGFDRRFRLKTFPLSLSLPWGLWLGPLPGYLPLPTKIAS